MGFRIIHTYDYSSYVGSYQTAQGKFIVVGLAWNKKLSYVDTKTGGFGTLEESGKDAFTGKEGLTNSLRSRERRRC